MVATDMFHSGIATGRSPLLMYTAAAVLNGLMEFIWLKGKDRRWQGFCWEEGHSGRGKEVMAGACAKDIICNTQ